MYIKIKKIIAYQYFAICTCSSCEKEVRSYRLLRGKDGKYDVNYWCPNCSTSGKTIKIDKKMFQLLCEKSMVDMI